MAATLSAIENLRNSLEATRIKNTNSRYFIPEEVFESSLSYENVSKCLKETDIEVFDREDCLKAVLNGGRKVFAILVLLDKVKFINNFVDNGPLVESRELDSGLPYDSEKLKIIFENEAFATYFQERQWEVLAPFFGKSSSHRTLHEDTILPFIDTEDLADGGYGSVSKEILPANHHGFPYTGEVVVIRKLIKPLLEDPDENIFIHVQDPAFTSEVRILSLLRSLSHPNIIELLASYTIKRSTKSGPRFVHNMLFPVADAPLSKMLRTSELGMLGEQFPSQEALFQQVHGLSSALESLHNYFSGEYELRLIGCHYDLNPRNILVRQGKLLLADFGLSRLNPDGSKTIFKSGKGDYLAPECERIEDEQFKKGIASRPSDVWSFGCVMLDIITHVHLKSKGLEEFKESRRGKALGCYTSFLFHAFGKPHPAVVNWIEKLKGIAPSLQHALLGVVAEMLQIDPLERPLIVQVTTRIYLELQRSKFETLRENFNRLAKLSSSLEVTVERERFLLWGWSCKIIEDDRIPFDREEEVVRDWLSIFSKPSDGVSSLFAEVEAETLSLLELLESKKPIVRPLYIHIRHLVDRLWALVPRSLVERMESLLEERIVSTDDQAMLRSMQSTLQTDTPYRGMYLLATMKYMTSKVEDAKKTGHGPLLLQNYVPSTKSGIHRFGTLASADNTENLVLIEHMSYNPEWMGQGHSDELYSRVDSLADLLSKRQMPNGLNILRCRGYFLDVSQTAFGLAYSLPGMSSIGHIPTTLKELLTAFKRPPLGDIFRLALSISNCVLQFHKIGWLHKNISSHNIIFFDNELCQRPSPVAHRIKAKEQPPVPSFQNNSQGLRPSSGEKDIPLQKKRIGFSKLKLFSKNTRSESSEGLASTSATSLPKLEVPEIKAAERSSSSLRVSADQLDAVHPGFNFQDNYLVGFNHSRPDEDIAFTTGASRDLKQKPYQHPEYQMHRTGYRFRPEFDYYSVGVVLLEIGLWQSLEDIVERSIGSYPPAQQKELWLSNFVPGLGVTMGTMYEEAVRICLSGRFGSSSESGLKPRESFERSVVRELGRCRA